MATSTYIALANLTLGSNQTTIAFSSIPATYRDLVIVFDGTSVANVDANFEFNDDGTNTNYNFVFMSGNGSTASSSSANSWNWALIRTDRTMVVTHIMDYSATDKHKTSITRNNIAANSTGAYASRWANTNAINKIELTAGGTSFASGSTFALYGIVS